MWKYKIGVLVGVFYTFSYWIPYFGEELFESVFGENVISWIFPFYTPILFLSGQLAISIWGTEAFFFGDIPAQIFIIDIILFVFCGALLEFFIRKLFHKVIK